MEDYTTWNEIVCSFKDFDIYFLINYVQAFKIHGDGEPFLMFFEDKSLRAINVFLKRDVSQFAPFKGVLESETYYDVVTPYGYGGFLFEGDTSEDSIKQFYAIYFEFMKKERIISGCRRYHPLLRNADIMRNITDVIDLGKTIVIDLVSEETINQNLSKQNRNRIRKARESEIVIHHGKGISLLNEFMNIYNTTMDSVLADSYYYFKKDFYLSIHHDMYEHYEVFYAVLNDKTIASSIFIHANNRLHCHLLGSYYEYRNLSPSNLLIYEAACWGYRQGFKTLHLGGGLGSTEDNLLQFKKTFNRHSDYTFSIGRETFIPEMYDKLVEIRKKKDSNFDPNLTYFPLYRAI